MNFEELLEAKMNDLNIDRPLEESIGLGIATVGLGVAAWAFIRNQIQKMREVRVLAIFLREADPRDELERMIEDVFKKFRLVRSLTDLDRMESEIAKVTNRLEYLKRQARNFDVNSVKVQKSFGRGETTVDMAAGSKVFALDAAKEKKRLETVMNKFVDDTIALFNREIEDKKNELYA